MNLVIISDTHNKHEELKLPEGDVIIHCGDITIDGSLEEVRSFLKWFEKLDFPYKLLVAGNHDFYIQNNPIAFRKLLDESIIYLENEAIEIEGFHFYGSPYTYTFGEWAFQRRRGFDMAKIWMGIPEATDVLITHGPPYGVLDWTVTRVNAGCKELYSSIKEINPKYHVFGHIHEAAGRMKSNETVFINASMVDVMYNVVNEPVVVVLEKT